jgi:hypothetical protein
MTKRHLSCALIAVLILSAAPAYAQLNGENLLGDMGVKSGTQPEPGLYLGSLYYRYRTETIRNANGDRVTFDPNQRGSQTIHANVPLVIYVSRAKIFGANYGMMAVMPFANGALDAPAFGLTEDASNGPGDAYVMPIQLGWHGSRADVTTGFAFFAPTGRYEVDATDNLGKGMWSYEVSGGTTVFLDRRRTVSLATSAYWETHTKKKDTGDVRAGNVTLTGVRVGQLMTLEGGVGKSFLGGAASVGMAYYAQWKITADRFGVPVELPGDPSIDRHRVFAYGPDVTVPIALKSKLISLVNVRYLWETGARIKTEGPSFLLTATFPVPSIKIPVR